MRQTPYRKTETRQQFLSKVRDIVRRANAGLGEWSDHEYVLDMSETPWAICLKGPEGRSSTCCRAFPRTRTLQLDPDSPPCPELQAAITAVEEGAT